MTSLIEAANRRLAILSVAGRKLTEEFYNQSQPRDKSGKWTSGGGLAPSTGTSWTGPSAHPDKRMAPKSSLTFPIERDTYETHREANMRFARGVFDTDLGGGYSSRVKSVDTYDTNEMTVQGEIVHNGRVVGTFNRSIEIEKRGVAVAYHTELLIEPLHQNKGLGEKFNAHAVSKYQEMGFDRIVTHAGEDVGGFAWARKGFRWGDPVASRKVMYNALNKAQSGAEYKPVLRPFKEEVIDEIAAVRGAIERGEDVQPIHIAAIGKDRTWETRTEDGRTYTTWAGKEAMLGANYEAVYYFDANTAVTAAAMRIELGYNPNQKRDKTGKWTSAGGGGSDHPVSQQVKCTPPPCSDESIHKPFDMGRRVLHTEIVHDMISVGNPPPSLVILGGGGGAGKSTIAAQLDLGKTEATINADDVKTRLPDYQKLAEVGDPTAAAYVHEESSVVAKKAQELARERGVGVVLDQVGSNPAKVAAQIQSYVDAGYEDIKAVYVTVPTQVALDRAESRAKRSGRAVPTEVLKAAHRDVSNGFEEIARNPALKSVELYDNRGSEPVLIARGGNGTLTVVNQKYYDEFLAKGEE